MIRENEAFDKKWAVENKADMEAFRASFEEDSIAGRLRQLIGPEPSDVTAPPDLTDLAASLLATPDALAENWQWITSGEAADAWRLGETLAKVDTKGVFERILLPLSYEGTDFRMACGYLSAKKNTSGAEWYEAWLREQFSLPDHPVELLFEVARRCGLSEEGAELMSRDIRRKRVQKTVAPCNFDMRP